MLKRICLCRRGHIEPGPGQRPQIRNPGAEQESEILHRTGAGVVIGRAVHLGRGHARRVGGGPGGQIGHVAERARQRHRQRPLAHQRAERIGAEPAAQGLAAHAVGLRRRDMQGGGRQERGPGLQPHPGGVEPHPLERLRQIARAGNRHPAVCVQSFGARVVGIQAVAGGRIEAQGHRGGAAGEVVEDLRVRPRRIGMIRFLADIPAMLRIAQRRGRPGERREARHAGGIVAGREDGLGVQRLQVDPVIAAGNHAFFEGRALQVGCDALAPRGVIDRGKIRARLKRVRHYLDPPEASRSGGSSETDVSLPAPAL